MQQLTELATHFNQTNHSSLPPIVCFQDIEHFAWQDWWK
jgi:hypothetical protein